MSSVPPARSIRVGAEDSICTGEIIATNRASVPPDNGATTTAGLAPAVSLTVGGFVAASTEVLIGDASAQHVLIRPLSRSNPGLFDDRDGNWIECEIEVVAGGFRGAFTADMRSEEFHAFMDQVSELGRTIDGAATFTTMEGQLALVAHGRARADSQGRRRGARPRRRRQRCSSVSPSDAACLPAISRSLESPPGGLSSDRRAGGLTTVTAPRRLEVSVARLSQCRRVDGWPEPRA